MTRVYSRFSGCDTVGCSAKGKNKNICVNNDQMMIEAWMTSAWGRLGTMKRISVWSPQLDTSPSALSTAPLNNIACTSIHEPAMARRLISKNPLDFSPTVL